MSHHRLFVALRPPPEVRAALLGLMGGIEGARWQNDNQLHITLAFLGELDRHDAEAAAEALETVVSPPLDLRLGEFGTFEGGRPGHTAILWAGVEPARPLSALAAGIRQACRRAGLDVEGRRFVPHITLARFGAAGAPRMALAPFLSHAVLPRLGWEARDVHLVESRMGRGGSHYAPVASWPLTGSSADPHRS